MKGGGAPVESTARAATTRVKAPTLLIVGVDDEPVIEMNRDAMRQMSAPVELEIVPGATHLFEEPGTLEQVMELAAAWFSAFLEERIVPGIEFPRESEEACARCR